MAALPVSVYLTPIRVGFLCSALILTLGSCTGRTERSGAGSEGTSSQATSGLGVDVHEASEYPVGKESREAIGLQHIGDIDLRLIAEYQRRIAFCMSERGFEYIPIKTRANEQRDFWRMRNPLNQDIAQQFGYHDPPSPFAADTNTHSAAFDAALLGTSEDGLDGCGMPTRAVVYAQVDAPAESLNSLLNSLVEYTTGFLGSEEGARLNGLWKSCMAGGGYAVDSQDDARARFMIGERPSAEELAARMMDYECDVKVGLTVARSGWEAAAVERWIEDFATAWSEVTRQFDEISGALTLLEGQTLTP